jgi:osmotically inducible protein OsmC
MRMASGAYQGGYSFGSRFEEEAGTNPEELIAAAHAGCYSMAFSGNLERAGFVPERVTTTARVHVNRGESGFQITRIDLETEAVVPGIDEATFQAEAEKARKGCPVSKALGAVGEITLNARLAS